MRQVTTLALMIILVLSSGACAKSEMRAGELALEVRTEYLQAETLTLNAQIVADYSDRVYEFGVKFTGNAAEGDLTITSPDSVAGMSARVTLDKLTLIYDGAQLDTGALTTGGISPAKSIVVLIAQWQSGYIRASGFETVDDIETVFIETDIEDNTKQKTWFDAKTHLPVRSELYDDDNMVVAVVFDNVTLESERN